eukprot:77375-Prymnesium_polylepis.1
MTKTSRLCPPSDEPQMRFPEYVRRVVTRGQNGRQTSLRPLRGRNRWGRITSPKIASAAARP